MKSIVRIIAGIPIFNTSDFVNARQLAANTAESFTVPTGADYVNISSNVDIYVNFTSGGTATVPGDVTNGSACALNPQARAVIPGETYSVISESAGHVTLEFYTGQ